MAYYDSKRNVDAYMRMAAGYDGSVLVAVLERHLPAGSSVLEIGMGPGKDLHLLSRRFHPTGSDRSVIFVDHVRAAQPEADVLLLDAVTMQTDRRFDAVYSNKVLHQLTRDELVRSLHSQRRVLNSGGIAVHGLWYGDRLETDHSGQCQYYTRQTFAEAAGELFEILDTGSYVEDSADDSLYVVLRRPPENRERPSAA